MLEQRIAEFDSYVKRVLPEYRAPAIMCSFGKDSMVMLHRLRVTGHLLPAIFYTDPYFPKKYAWAREIIADWNLEVYDYPPSFVTLAEGKDIMAFTNHYQIGNTAASYLQLPKNIVEPEEGQRWVCGLKILQRPCGTFRYPWDAVFIGHKDTDRDQIAGSVKLNVELKKNAGLGPDLLFPLRTWTDDDIWDYTDKFKVPQQWDRYEGRGERKDKSANSDYAHVCIACCDKRSKEDSAYCPLVKMQVSNIAGMVPYQPILGGYYGNDAGSGQG